jgi:hypothetical protein
MTDRTGPPPVTPGGVAGGHTMDTVAESGHWDAPTAAVVLGRLAVDGDPSFFAPREWTTVGALFDELLAQHDDPRVPVRAMVDRRLARGETDGWAHADLPEDGDAWRLTLAWLDEDARRTCGCGFAEASRDDRHRLIGLVQGADTWHGVQAGHVWSLWTRYACAAFYAHPWAWNEIGFDGPAYPRGYLALGVGRRDRWEPPPVASVRTTWRAIPPPTAPPGPPR